MSISREVLSKYITKGCTFIETGTRWGTTCVRAFDLGANPIYTCERDPLMSNIAQLHLRDIDALAFTVTEEESPNFLEGMYFYGGGSVVYLDAHTEFHSPILQELKEIAKWENTPSVILIDDLRCMEWWGVKYEQIIEAIEKIGKYKIGREDGVVEGDILVATRL